MIEWMVYQVHRLLSAADRLDQIVFVGTGPVRICFRPLEQQATKAAFFGAAIIRRIKFLFGHRHSPVKNEAGLMKQSGSVQMKKMMCLPLWKIAWVQTLTSLCICLPYEEQV